MCKTRPVWIISVTELRQVWSEQNSALLLLLKNGLRHAMADKNGSDKYKSFYDSITRLSIYISDYQEFLFTTEWITQPMKSERNNIKQIGRYCNALIPVKVKLLEMTGNQQRLCPTFFANGDRIHTEYIEFIRKYSWMKGKRFWCFVLSHWCTGRLKR